MSNLASSRPRESASCICLLRATLSAKSRWLLLRSSSPRSLHPCHARLHAGWARMFVGADRTRVYICAQCMCKNTCVRTTSAMHMRAQGDARTCDYARLTRGCAAVPLSRATCAQFKKLLQEATMESTENTRPLFAKYTV